MCSSRKCNFQSTTRTWNGVANVKTYLFANSAQIGILDSLRVAVLKVISSLVE